MTLAAQQPPEADAAAPSPPRLRLPSGALLLAGAAVLLVGASAAMAWGLTLLLGSAELAAPLSTALALVAGVLPLAVLLVKLARALDRSRQQLARLDTLDVLTGVANRSHFIAMAERELARARRYGSGAALLVVDIDRFQKLAEGGDSDAVLRALARHTEPSLRGADALARFGPAALAVWLAQADPIGALDVAERIRERIESLDIPGARSDKPLRVSVSVGVAALRPAHQTLAAVIDDAESALLAARQAGGNCVRAAPVDRSRLRRIGPSVGDNRTAN